MNPETLIKKNKSHYGHLVVAITKAFEQSKNSLTFDPTAGDVIEIAEKVYREMTKNNLLK